MPGKPSMKCAECGNLMWRKAGHSLPEGKARCLTCRRQGSPVPRQSLPYTQWPLRDFVCASCGGAYRSRKKRPVSRCKGNCGKGRNCPGSRGPADPAERLAQTRARYRAKNYRRRTARRTFDITPEFERGLRRKARRCPLCRVRMVDQPFLPASKELDHIIPINVGGTHTIGNVRIICRACNVARPLDGSDYTGPVTLWAQAPDVVPATGRAA